MQGAGIGRQGPAEQRVADAAHTHAGLRERGVLVKNVSALHPLLADCLRLTVGTPEENALMLAALESSLQASP